MAGTRTTTRQSGRAERTREALIRAGRRLFAEQPVDAVAIDVIVRAADVAKGSFYNHFADKEALVRAVTVEIRSGVERAVGRANAGIDDPARRVAPAICVYIRYAIDEPERAGVLVRVHSGHTSTSAPLNQGLVEDVASGPAAAARRRTRFAAMTQPGPLVATTTHTADGTAVERAHQVDEALRRAASRSLVDHGPIPARMRRPDSHAGTANGLAQ